MSGNTAHTGLGEQAPDLVDRADPADGAAARDRSGEPDRTGRNRPHRPEQSRPTRPGRGARVESEHS
ncbi:hypothetical protein GCM10023405_25510 [Streptomonospora salina]